MGILRRIKLFLGLMSFKYSTDRWVLTKDYVPPSSKYLFYHNHGRVTPNKHWPCLWKCTKLVYIERTLSGRRDYVAKEVPVLLHTYKGRGLMVVLKPGIVICSQCKEFMNITAKDKLTFAIDEDDGSKSIVTKIVENWKCMNGHTHLKTYKEQPKIIIN